VGVGFLAVLLALPGLAPVRAHAGEENLEPRPPWIFFTTPDEETARAIDALVNNSFADYNKIVGARDLLVRRYGAWSVDRLYHELIGATNQPALLNSILTVAALRGRMGAAPELAVFVRPLIELARSNEEWRRAAALLALGSFHGPDGVGRPRQRVDKLIPSDDVAEARRLFEQEGLPIMWSALRDGNLQVRASAALALGKTGGNEARRSLIEGQPPKKDASVPPRMAVMLGLGLLSSPEAGNDLERFVEAISDSDRRIRAAAALGAALQVVSESPAPWTESPEPLLRKLASSDVSEQKEDAAEAVFAQGCLAWLRQRPDLWEDVLSAAVTGADQVVEAADQVLVWCEDTTVRARMLQQLTTNTAALKDPTVAAFLLCAGSDAGAEGVKACRSWLGKPARTPRADKDWDPRWHACVGLLRALAAGRPDDGALRREVLEALDDAVSRGLDRDAPLLPLLAELLRAHRGVLARPNNKLPEEALRAVESGVRCRYGLLNHDLVDTAVARANAMIRDEVYLLANLRGLKADTEKDKDGGAKRIFDAYLRMWPYLSRLDLRSERGRRPAPTLQFDDPAKVLDRR
jgi:hypothetical protein